MISDTSKNYRGHKAKIGNIMATKRGLGVQVGYCEHCHAKHALTLDEARDFAKLFNRQKKRLMPRLAIALLKRMAVE